MSNHAWTLGTYPTKVSGILITVTRFTVISSVCFRYEESFAVILAHDHVYLKPICIAKRNKEPTGPR